MVRTEFDPPEDLFNYPCKICGVPLKRVTHYWVLDRWLHATVHDRCAEAWSKNQETQPKAAHEVPQKFRDFHPGKADAEAMRLCGTFSPDSRVKTLLIAGMPSKGKSRLLWETVRCFFEDLGHGWPEAFGFESLIAEYDKQALLKIAQSRYVLVDDIGAIESYGRERAALQAAIRTRIKRDNCWTFLTVDNFSFDPDLENICRDRALIVVL